MTLKRSCNRNHDQKDNTSPPSPKHHDSKHQVDLFQALLHLLRLLDSLTLARLALTSKYKDEDDSDGHKDDICINKTTRSPCRRLYHLCWSPALWTSVVLHGAVRFLLHTKLISHQKLSSGMCTMFKHTYKVSSIRWTSGTVPLYHCTT